MLLGSQICRYFSHFCTYRKGFSESKSGSVSNTHNNSSMVRSTMVSRAFKNVCKKPTSFTSTQRSTERSCRKVESTRNTEFTATNGLENLRQNLLAEGISENASNLVTNNKRTLQSNIMSQLGRSGVAGVLNGRYLPLDRI